MTDNSGLMVVVRGGVLWVTLVSQMMNMSLLLDTMAEFTSVTWYELESDATGDRAMLFRPEIHADLA